jgi:hypothetical protein
MRQSRALLFLPRAHGKAVRHSRACHSIPERTYFYLLRGNEHCDCGMHGQPKNNWTEFAGLNVVVPSDGRHRTPFSHV